jgi:chromosome segregation ATPase
MCNTALEAGAMTGLLIASVIAAATSVVVALLTARAVRRNGRDLETLKAHLAAAQSADLRLTEEIRLGSTHLQALISSIQTLKDALSTTGAAPRALLLSEATWKALEPAVVNVQSTYASAVAVLTDHELQLAHRAKGLAQQLQSAFSRFTMTGLQENATQLDSDIHEVRNELTALQMELRDARLSRVVTAVSVYSVDLSRITTGVK